MRRIDLFWTFFGCPLLAIFLTLPVQAAALSATGDRALLQIFVNEVDKGEMLAWVRSGDVLVRLVDLESAGIRNIEGTRETIGTDVYVSLATLAPRVTNVYDEKALTVRLTVQASMQGATVLDLAPQAPSGMMYTRDTSLFLNYAVQSTGVSSYNVFGEGGLSVDGHLLTSTVNRTDDGQIVRGLSSLVLNYPTTLVRWTLGDGFATNGGLGGSAYMGGINVSRNFSLNPYFYSFPRPGFSGTALTPSTVSVYSDGGLLQQQTIAPGQFQLQNLPVANGYRVNQVVIRDIFGRETQIMSPFYLSTQVLKSGVSAYSYNVGVLRNNVATSSWDYGDPVAMGFYRYGLNDTVTPGAQFEATSHVADGGLRLTTKTLFGQLDFSAMGSQSDSVGGSAASATYSFLRRWLSFGANFTAMSPHYATVSLPVSADRAEVQATGLLGFPIGSRISVNLTETYSRFRDTGESLRTGVSGNVKITESLSFFSSNSWTQQTGGSTAVELYVGLSYFFGHQTTANVFAQHQSGHTQEGVSIQKSLPVGEGLGYRFQGTIGEQSPQQQGQGQVQYQGPYNLYQAQYSSTTTNPIFTVSGAVVALGGSVHATRVVNDGFALIRTPDVPDVRGYVNNQEVGRTNSKGELIVPNNMVPYYGNRISINEHDVPMDYRVDATEKTVAPPFRGGSVVTFPVTRLQVVTGTVRLDVAGQVVVPAYGVLTVTVDGKAFESPIGKQGEFYLENVPAGRHTTVIEYKQTSCTATLSVPVASDSFLKLGEIRCTASPGEKP